MAPSPPTKPRPEIQLISQPMPLMSRAAREELYPPQKSQGQIAEEYRTLPRNGDTQGHILVTRSVSTSSDTKPLLPAQPVASSNSYTTRVKSPLDRQASTRQEPRTTPYNDRMDNHLATLPVVARKVVPRYDLQVDVGPIFDSFLLARDALIQRRVERVSRTSQMFLVAVRMRKEELARAPQEVQCSQQFTQALRDVCTWETLFKAHCSKVGPDTKAVESESFYATAEAFLIATWNSVGVLVEVCCQELRKYESHPEQYAYLNGAPTNTDQEIINEIHALLEKPSKLQPESRKSLIQNLLLRLPKFSLAHRPKDPGELEDDSSSISSFTLVESFPASVKSRPSTSLSGTRSSIDSDVLNSRLGLRASRIIFSSVNASLARSRPPNTHTRADVIRDDKGAIISATVKELVRLFTDPVETLSKDMLSLLDTFFCFFRNFTTPQLLLKALIDRYNEHLYRPRSLVKVHVMRMIAFWLINYYLAQHDEVILDPIRDFSKSVSCDPDVPVHAIAQLLDTPLAECKSGKKGRRYAPIIEDTLKRYEDLNMGAGNKKTGFETRVEVFKRAHDPTRNIDIDILAFKVPGGAEELARALTCRESDIYHRYAPSELVKSTEKNPHELMKEMTSWSNALSLFVVNSVMGHCRATSRAEVVELLIEVAVICKRLRNYSSALSILLGLDSRPVMRLKKTLKVVSNGHLTMCSGLRDFFHRRANYMSYREELSSEICPAVPLIFVVQSDLIKIRAAQQEIKEKYIHKDRQPTSPLVDIQMYRKMRSVIRPLELYSAPYNFASNDFVEGWILSKMKSLKDASYEEMITKLMQESMTLEPPTPPPSPARSWISELAREP